MQFATLVTGSDPGVNLVNGSFEAGPAVPTNAESITLGVGSTAMTGWTITHGEVYLFDGYYWQAKDGVRSIVLSGSGSVAQTFSTIPGAEYTMHFSVAGNDGNGAARHLQISAAGAVASFESPRPLDMGWRDETFIFTATENSSMLEFKSLDDTWGGPVIDNVSVTGTIDFTHHPSGVTHADFLLI